MKNKIVSALSGRTFKQGLTLAIITAVLSSCVAGGGAGTKRNAVPSLSNGESTTSGCGLDSFYLLNSSNTCVTICPDGTHEATTEEITALALTTGQQEFVASSKGLCVTDAVKIVRPNLDITFNSDYCACVDGKSALKLDRCNSYCAERPNDNRILRGTVNVGASIDANSLLGDLNGWCTVQINDGADDNTQCQLVATDIEGNELRETVTTFSGQNRYEVPLSGVGSGRFSFNKIYSAYIEEITSQSRSKSFQFEIKDTSVDETTSSGLLKIAPTTQYSCLSRSGSSDGTNTTYSSAFKTFFYFTSAVVVDPLLPNTPFLVCHEGDPAINDSISFPRFEQIPGQFALWDKTDSRMVDADSDGFPDFNNTLRTQIQDKVGQDVGQIFNSFKWPTGPAVSSLDANGTEDNFSAGDSLPVLGTYMIPWTDSDGKAFCPDDTHLNDSDSLFNVLRPYIQETEGIYLAQREGLTYTQDGTTLIAPVNVIIIRESLLMKAGFYQSGSLRIGIDENSLQSSKTIHFYWPYDPNDVAPFQEKGDQRLYTVKLPSSIGGVTNSGLQTSVQPVDKRFGCVPKNGDIN